VSAADDAQRIDRWLWHARFFRTRSLAADAVRNGRIEVNGARAKAAKLVQRGDRLTIRRPPFVQDVEVLGVVEQRLGAPLAEALYRESEASVAARTELAARLAAQRVREAPREGKLEREARRARGALKRHTGEPSDAP